MHTYFFPSVLRHCQIILLVHYYDYVEQTKNNIFCTYYPQKALCSISPFIPDLNHLSLNYLSELQGSSTTFPSGSFSRAGSRRNIYSCDFNLVRLPKDAIIHEEDILTIESGRHLQSYKYGLGSQARSKQL